MRFWQFLRMQYLLQSGMRLLQFLLFALHASRCCAGPLNALNNVVTDVKSNLQKLGDRVNDYLGLVQIELMTQCRLDCSAELRYNGYGCYCGIGGNGTALDGIDACCQMHDACYDAAVAAGACNAVQRYMSVYDWSCVRNWPWMPGLPTCEDRNGGCGRAICQCDQQLVSCWSLFPKPECKRRCMTGECLNSAVAVLRTVFGRDALNASIDY